MKLELSEFDIQCQLFAWARHPATLKKYPCLDLLFSINNGLKLNIGQAVKAKKSGTNRGIPDIFLPVARRHFAGLFIEVKKKETNLRQTK